MQGALNSVALDTVVQGVLTELAQTEVGETVRFLHHIGDVDLPMDNIRSWIVNEGDISAGEKKTERKPDIAEIPSEEWISRVAEQGMHPALVELMQSFAVDGEMTFPRLVKHREVS